MIESFREGWSDFLQTASLCRRAGCSERDLVATAAREALDNAYDASPTGVEAAFADRTLTIHDRGPGLSPAQVKAIFDIKRPSLSSKRWRLARRGALGNGARVILGVVHASQGCLIVESRKLGWELDITPDGETRVRREFNSEIEEGARLSVVFGPKLEIDAAAILRLIELCKAGAGRAYGGSRAFPTWFDGPAIRELLRDAPPETSVLEFAKSFDLTGAALGKIKSIAARTTTSALLRDEAALGWVTEAILAGGSPARRELKRMGRNARPGADSYAYEVDTFSLGDAVLPVVVECWATGTALASRKKADKANGVITIGAVFTNRAPSVQESGEGDVDADSRLLWVRFGGAASGWFVSAGLKTACNFNIDIAVTAPELPILGDGKACDIEVFREPISRVIAAAARKAHHPPGKVAAPVKPKVPAMSPRDAIFAVLENAYNEMIADDPDNLRAPNRMLYYAIRPAVLQLTNSDKLSYKSFNDAVLAYQVQYPGRVRGWRIDYESRGEFVEPGGASFGLGTREVDEFVNSIGSEVPRFDGGIGEIAIEHNPPPLRPGNNPAQRFGAILCIEKAGYEQLFRQSKIAERFDLGLCFVSGQPTTAVRRLVDEMAALGCRVFVLRDLDIAGFSIAHTIGHDNDRYAFRNDISVIDLGLRLADAEALRLEREPFADVPAKAKVAERLRLERYGATRAEVEMLVDQRMRVELDAMKKPRQLINFVEQKLREHGVKKCVPPQAALEAIYRHEVSQIRVDRALAPLRAEVADRIAEATEEIDRSGLLDIEVPPLGDAILAHYDSHPAATANEAVRAIARADEAEAAS